MVGRERVIKNEPRPSQFQSDLNVKWQHQIQFVCTHSCSVLMHGFRIAHMCE